MTLVISSILHLILPLLHKTQCHVFCFFYLDNLLIDYQFTFSLLQEDDHYYTAINFMATPEQVWLTIATWCNRNVMLPYKYIRKQSCGLFQVL